MSVRSTSCCGLYEFYGFDNFTSFRGLLQHMLDNNSEYHSRRFILFTDIVRKRKICGASFAKFISENELGEVVATRSKTNENSGNRLICYIWDFNRTKVKKYLLKPIDFTTN